MSIGLKSPLLVAVLHLVFIQFAVCDRLPLGMKMGLSKEIKEHIKIQQVKQRILRGLNMTAAPHSFSVTEKPPRRAPKATTTNIYAMEKKASISMILSESTDPERTDTLTFKLDSRFRDHAEDVQSAALVFRLRTYRTKTLRSETIQNTHDEETTNSTGNGGTGLKSTRRPKKEVTERDDIILEKTDIHSNNSSSLDENNSSRRSKIRNKPKKARKDRKNRRMRRLRPRRVKVVIKLVNEITGERKRLAVERIRVKKTSTMTVPLAKDILLNAAASANHTLTLQMKCKRCNKKVEIERVYKTPKRKTRKSGRRRRRRLNPNRPFLLIKTGNNAASYIYENKNSKANQKQGSRLKRDVGIECPSNFKTSTEDNHISSHHGCCSVKIFVTFKELGLDNIILSPSGMAMAYCMGSCNSNARSTRSTTDIFHKKKVKNVTSKLASSSLLGSILDISSHLQRPRTLQQSDEPEQTVPDILRVKCMSVQRSSLDVVYIDQLGNIHNKRLDNVVDEACGCSKHLSSF